MGTLSYWQRTARASINYQDLPATADLVIIGGGIMGVSSAYFAALAGLNTVLIDQVALAYGATGRNGGFIGGGAADSYSSVRERYGAETAQSIWGYTRRNRALVHEMIAREGFDFDFRQPGTLNLALNDDEAASMRANIAAFEADGGPAGESVWLDHPEAQALIDTPLSEEVVGCAFKPSYALVHSAKLVYGLGAAAAARSAKFCIGKVHAIENVGDDVRVSTYTGAIDARAVIVAGNAWTDELLPTLRGVITPVRGQVLTYAPGARVFRTGMGASVTPTGEYWQQTLDGSILIGGCRADAPDREWNVRDDALRAEVQTPLARVIPRLFPQLENLTVAQRWAGPMAFTADYLPVIDAAPGVSNAWVAGGFNGSGMGFGLVTGATLVEAVSSGVKPAALAPFALGRAGLRATAA